MTRCNNTYFSTTAFGLGAIIALTLAGGCEAKLVYGGDTGQPAEEPSELPDGDGPGLGGSDSGSGPDIGGGEDSGTPPPTSADCPADQFCPFEDEESQREGIGMMWDVLSGTDCWIGSEDSVGAALAQMQFGGEFEYAFLYAEDPSSGESDVMDSGELGLAAIGLYNGGLLAIVSTFTGEEEYIQFASETSMMHSFPIEGEYYGIEYQASSSCY